MLLKKYKLMNWSKNSENYPACIELFDKFIHVNKILPSKRRYLYDFFDNYNLFIEIRKETDKCRYIVNGQNIMIYGQCMHNCRRDAEDAAFTKCFEIMENKLQQQINK